MNHPCIAAMLKGRGDAKAPEVLMLALLILSHDENHVTEGSFEWLAKLYGCNDRNAKLLIAKLKASGLLKVSKTAPKSGHSQNAYRVATCDIVASASSDSPLCKDGHVWTGGECAYCEAKMPGVFVPATEADL